MYKEAFHTQEINKLNFLVTGGAGFIGSNLVEYLLTHQAARVVVLDNYATGFAANLESFKQYKNLEIIEGDICSIEDCIKACKNIDYVLHQAALGSVPRSVENPIATNKVNVDGFLNILVAARDAKVKRFVYASSSSVYGDSKTMPKVESQIGKPLSPYAVTKLLNELYADVFSKTYQMEIIGLRYFNIFGPRQNPSGPYAAAIPLFMDALLSDKNAYINGDGEQTRDFTFVKNAVEANIRALFATLKPGDPIVYNVAVSDRISINKLYNTLKTVSGSQKNAVHRGERPGDIRDSLADISLAQRYLNYNPQIRVEEGLKITFDWFKNEFYNHQ
ncbi:MAG: SDR family oxidoreductase [Bacteroidia bacterium]|nr:SDR family oxidoreductase [Bacteroidia bacterium]MCZ2249890.1 SDR family oxidoreductase [Bacteroidia bacterium]